MGFLIELFWAVFMVGLPVAAFTLAIVWWSLQQGHFSESLDTKALEREIKAMSKKTKKNGKKLKPDLHPVQRKWAKFGSGFYGIVGFFTYIVIEVFEIISVIRNFGGLFGFLKQLDFDVIIQLFVSALTNFISAIIWPFYWLKRIDTDQTWLWFVVAYGGYWLGLRLAQALVQRNVGLKTDV
jgi:hypothetical protein